MFILVGAGAILMLAFNGVALILQLIFGLLNAMFSNEDLPS